MDNYIDEWYDAALAQGQGFKSEEDRQAYIASLGDDNAIVAAQGYGNILMKSDGRAFGGKYPKMRFSDSSAFFFSSPAFALWSLALVFAASAVRMDFFTFPCSISTAFSCHFFALSFWRCALATAKTARAASIATLMPDQVVFNHVT